MADQQVRDTVSTAFKKIHDEICHGLSEDTEQDYTEDKWDYENGNGGGITRIYQGEVIEKGGVNFSALCGNLSDEIAGKLKKEGSREFFATGVSLVIHPQNPFVPTVHMNIRYIDRGENAWFGGGIDLTPYYPDETDIIDFHKNLKTVCDKYDPEYYPKFKQECDDYFYINHRNEHRGVGGIFFDYMMNNFNQTLNFVLDIGKSFSNLYSPILTKHKNDPWTENQREFQLYRRGRYVEFNLVYDRGTLFGLETKGRIESILMSLPPVTSWTYNWKPEPETPEAHLYDLLKPRDWAAMG